MTTTLKVHVGGNYIANVTENDKAPVQVGPNEERSFYVPHGFTSTFTISEGLPEQQGPVLPEGDEDAE